MQSEKEVIIQKEPEETDPVYLAFLESQAELDRAQRLYEQGVDPE